jgi:hypothetical protein
MAELEEEEEEDDQAGCYTAKKGTDMYHHSVNMFMTIWRSCS